MSLPWESWVGVSLKVGQLICGHDCLRGRTVSQVDLGPMLVSQFVCPRSEFPHLCQSCSPNPGGDLEMFTSRHARWEQRELKPQAKAVMSR